MYHFGVLTRTSGLIDCRFGCKWLLLLLSFWRRGSYYSIDWNWTSLWERLWRIRMTIHSKCCHTPSEKLIGIKFVFLQLQIYTIPQKESCIIFFSFCSGSPSVFPCVIFFFFQWNLDSITQSPGETPNEFPRPSGTVRNKRQGSSTNVVPSQTLVNHPCLTYRTEVV